LVFEKGQAPLCKAPSGPFRRRSHTPCRNRPIFGRSTLRSRTEWSQPCRVAERGQAPRFAAWSRLVAGGRSIGRTARRRTNCERPNLTAFGEIERTKPIRPRWPELRNTLWKLGLDPVSHPEEHLTTWTDTWEGRRTEDGGRRAEDGGRRTEGGGRRAEDGGRRAEGGGRRAEDGGRRAEGGGRRAEDGGRRAEDGGRRAEGGGRRAGGRARRKA
jgi:hypothetical protein